MGLTPSARLRLLAALLFLSGFCALVYQMVWLREFRLIFGATTPATAAVLAVFMGGLGMGSAWLGRRADRMSGLLRWYGLIEMAVALSAFLTPFLLQGVRALYIKTGGVVALGSVTAILLHLLLAVVVLLVPCVLMGGTLPVAVKYLETDEDTQRGSTGLLYGLNALGALSGVVVSTFWLLERLGTRGTLWTAAGLNLALGGLAWVISSRERPDTTANRPADRPVRTGNVRPPAGSPTPAAFVYGAAFVTGFVFFLIELVWYRLLAPLMGSSTYNFGLILSLALAGIGLGGLTYRAGIAPREGWASLAVFSWVAAMQGFWLVLPYALGDRVAVFAFNANQLRALGFAGQLTGWTAVAALLVFLPSFFAGIQFPLLVSLLGRGQTEVGRQMGFAYAANTAGAIAGSLLGGFLLIPGLTAPGCWKLAVWLLCGLSLVAVMLNRTRGLRRHTGLAVVSLGISLFLSIESDGPTAAWRHSPIGYGRIKNFPESPAALKEYFNDRRRRTHREFEGRESSVGLYAGDSYAFFVNGKSDGSALGDAPTQVMLGLVSAILHPQPRSACVVGLGTGSTAGWLAEVPGLERVDVVEIEPGMCDLARDAFAPVNRHVLQKTNVQVILGDARETLLVRGAPYDLIVSEPSNPYRAGISSLYTREYYKAVQHRLNPGGIFSQWVQGYEVDSPTIRLVYSTLAAVFPHVETWVTEPNDLLFVCHQQPPAYTKDQLRQRVAAPPFKEALNRVWLVDSVDGFLARYYAGPAFARAIAAQERRVNTDDANFLEYGFARTLHLGGSFKASDIMLVAMRSRLDFPGHWPASNEPGRLLEERFLMCAAHDNPFELPVDLQGEAQARAEAILASVNGDYPTVLRRWQGEPRSLMARLLLAEAVAHAGTPDQGRSLLGGIEKERPAETRLAAARLAFRHGAPAAAIEHMKIALAGLRTDPWLRTRVWRSGFALAVELGKSSPEAAAAFFALLEQPLAVAAFDHDRLIARLELSRLLPPRDRVAAADAFGRYPPWNRMYLEFRRAAFEEAKDPRLAMAKREFDEFMAQSGISFIDAMFPLTAPPPAGSR